MQENESENDEGHGAKGNYASVLVNMCILAIQAKDDGNVV